MVRRDDGLGEWSSETIEVPLMVAHVPADVYSASPCVCNKKGLQVASSRKGALWSRRRAGEVPVQPPC